MFLQPLIYELQQLWAHDAETYDVSCKENIQMRAVLMWTISDFPVYGMLFGWTHMEGFHVHTVKIAHMLSN